MYRPYLSHCPGTIVGHLSPCPKEQGNLVPLERLVIITVDSDDSVVRSRYMVSTMLIWIVQQDSGKSLSFFLLLRSTCFTADRQPTNSAARWRHCRLYFYTVARKLRRCSSSRQPVAASALAFGLYEAVAAMRRRRNRAPLCRRPRWRPRPRAT